MKQKKFALISMITLLGMVLFTGCQKADTTAENNPKVHAETQSSATQTQEAEETTEETVPSSEADATDGIFAQMQNCDFEYSSGAGGWKTELKVNADGSFSGSYFDSEMGETGDDYPNGVMYSCDFEGKFTEPQKINDYTYKTTVDTITLDQTRGKEEIKDGVKYIYSDPYGLEDAKDILIYVKGAPVSELPEEYLNWVNYSLDDGTKLPFFGIYNENGDAGFSGWESSDSDGQSDIAQELAEIETKASDIEAKLQGEGLSQSDLNQLTGQLYTLWDDELNAIWQRLKDTQDADTMKKLTEEERQWIKEKDKKVKEAGKEFEGGTAQPMAENQEAADVTKARVYELAEYLK